MNNEDITEILDMVAELQQDIPQGRANALTISELAELWETDEAQAAEVAVRLILLGDVQLGFFREGDHDA